MATTIEDLKRWFESGKKEDATHMVVVCDTFDWEDYPVYVKKGDRVQKVIADHSGPNMTKVMEVYSYKKDFDKQTRSGRLCWDLD